MKALFSPRDHSLYRISDEIGVDGVGVVELGEVEEVEVLDVRERPGHVGLRIPAQHVDVLKALASAPQVGVFRAPELKGNVQTLPYDVLVETLTVGPISWAYVVRHIGKSSGRNRGSNPTTF